MVGELVRVGVNHLVVGVAESQCVAVLVVERGGCVSVGTSILGVALGEINTVLVEELTKSTLWAETPFWVVLPLTETRTPARRFDRFCLELIKTLPTSSTITPSLSTAIICPVNSTCCSCLLSMSATTSKRRSRSIFAITYGCSTGFARPICTCRMVSLRM